MGRIRVRTSGWYHLWQTLISFCLTSSSFLSQLAKQEQDTNLFRLVIMTLLIADTWVYNEDQCRYKGSSSLSEISMQVLSADLLRRRVKLLPDTRLINLSVKPYSCTNSSQQCNWRGCDFPKPKYSSRETQLSRTLLFDRGPAKGQQGSPLQGGRTPGANTSHTVIDLTTKIESKWM